MNHSLMNSGSILNTMAPLSRIDQVFAALIQTRYFVKGWGSPETLKRLFVLRKAISDQSTVVSLVDKNYPVTITKTYQKNDCKVMQGYFTSPLATVDELKGIMPKSVEKATFQMVFPSEWQDTHKPVCIQLSGTGDHGFSRRDRLMATPLAKEMGIGSILLTNPYYHDRKPKNQFRSSLHHVSDLFVMGIALACESVVLLKWCERHGLGPLALTGKSMGGHMACIAACNWPKPISLIPCLSWTTASTVFTKGVMSPRVSWKVLREQYSSNRAYREEISPMINSPEQRKPDSQCRDRFPEHLFNPQILNKNSQLDLDVASFMRGLMDEFTHLGNYSIPYDPSLVSLIVAKNDSYVPRDNVISLQEMWPGSTLQKIDSGHFQGLTAPKHHKIFQLAIQASIDKQIQQSNQTINTIPNDNRTPEDIVTTDTNRQSVDSCFHDNSYVYNTCHDNTAQSPSYSLANEHDKRQYEDRQ